MVTTILLFIIYLAFISLGLPDSILGVSIPSIRNEFGIGLSLSGIVSMVVISCTIVSSFMSGFLIKKFGTGKIVFISCFLTGAAMFGISLTPSFLFIIMLAVPLGLGGGSVDAALNNYVAMNYKAHHMNWLHSFWGVGATASPIIMATALNLMTWRAGYRIIALAQLSFSIILLISLPLWSKAKKTVPIKDEDEKTHYTFKNKDIIKNKGILLTLLTVMFYCSSEASVGLWGSSFLIETYEIKIDRAASIMSFYYGGITVGRFLSGFISFKLNNRQMIRSGMVLSLMGIIMVALQINQITASLGIIIIGLGFAPIYPAIIHETPARFGSGISQKLIGYQIGFAGIGGALISPLTGFLLQHTSLSMFPIFIAIAIIIMFSASELIDKSC